MMYNRLVYTMLTSNQKNVVLIFNKYLVQFLTTIRNINSTARETVKTILKQASVKAIDNQSDCYITTHSKQGSEDTDALSLHLFPGVCVSDFVVGIEGGEEIARPFALLLAVLSAAHASNDAALASQAIRAISAIQSKSFNAPAQIAAIFDEDVHNRLLKLVNHMSLTPTDTDATTNSHSLVESQDVEDGSNAFMDALAGSSIATIAKEIADDLVDSDLLKDFATDPASIDFASLLDPTSKLGGIAKVVSSKLQDQLGSGKLDQGKLMSEVMTMFGSLGGNGGDNPLLSQVMKMAKQMGGERGGGGGPKMPPSSTPGGDRGASSRARLVDKLAKRQTVSS